MSDHRLEYATSRAGDATLKGFDEPVALFEVQA